MRSKLSKNKIWITVFSTIATIVIMSLFLWFTVVKDNATEHNLEMNICFFITIAIFLVGYVLYAYFVNIEILRSARKLATVFTVFILSYVIVYFCCKINCNLAPYAMCTLVLTLLVDSKSAVFANVILLLVQFTTNSCYGTMGQNKLFACLFVGLATLTIAAFFAKNHNKRINYIWTGLALSAAAAITTSVVYFMYDTFDVKRFLIEISFALGSGMLNVMVMFIFVPLLERLFNITTDFRLAELTNVRQPLLKRLFDEAPGTFNHSMTVANYAEACAMAIGENTYLARAVGYYHDVGKLRNPVYFSENQRDTYNPHDEIAPEVSVSFLKNHIAYGISLARTYRLPVEIEKAISEHHGTFVMRFFYLKAKKYTEGELAVADYCYDGPTPTTKINGILMIVDACEATLRSLSVSDKAKAEKVVEGIVKERMDFGQFDNCDLTMKEIDIIKQTIITTYMGARHERVKYPELKLAPDTRSEEAFAASSEKKA